MMVDATVGNIYQANPEGAHEVIIHDQFKSYPKTDAMLRQEEAVKEGQKIKKILTISDLMPVMRQK